MRTKTIIKFVNKISLMFKNLKCFGSHEILFGILI